MAKTQQPNDARSIATQVITEVVAQQRSLTPTLAQYLDEVTVKDRSFCQQLCYGVIRHYAELVFISRQLINKPFKAKDTDIEVLLLIGLYQLRSLRTPAHAAISETVNTAKKLGKNWATGLLNACLRNYQRRQVEIDQALAQQPDARLAHPEWLIKRYQQDWPAHWQAICEANNQQAPMMLRVNLAVNSRDDYLAELTEADIAATPLDDIPSGIILTQARDVFSLPGFSEGHVSVQDGAAQRVATLMAIQPQQRILDACAAPGGKTGHLLELMPSNEVIAMDIAASRLEQIQQNADRLQLSPTLICADAADPDSWWDGELFDRILIDAPCSGTGVIRRHPDIKLLRREADIEALSQIQQQMLAKLWPLLKPDGLMVYTTCSALKQENEQQIEHFLQQHPDAEEVRFNPPPATERPFGYQRLPGDNTLDGFFYACLRHR